METLPVLRSVCFPCLSKFRGDGAGISIAHCHALVDGFSSVGFHKAFARNICVEVLPGDVDTVQFNERLVLESAGKLPGLHALRFASISGSRTNACLRCIKAEVVHEKGDESITEGGRVSLTKVRAKDPCLAEAVCSGMRWLVISRDAVDRWPSLPQVIQSAANSANHLSTGESELQLARKILAKWKDQSGDGKRMITWSDISKSVLQSKPSQSMTCPAIFAFVLSFGGGRASDWLFGTESFVRSHGHPDKNLGFDVQLGL